MYDRNVSLHFLLPLISVEEANAALCLQELHERVNHLAMLTSEAQARFGLLSCAPPPMMAEPVLTH